ncbi:hypothetical protein ABIB40_000911 [Pedobacter sp. UYP30]|uniref:hypothetical protein n=1 Tax=Pedobacter sp. UYP30 TaxID=1756400 RepID=UPI003396179D
MKTHAQLSKAKDGVGKKKSLKLTQLGGRISARITRVKSAINALNGLNALSAIEITDEYFFGYTDIHQNKSNRENTISDSVDLEVRYGLL